MTKSARTRARTFALQALYQYLVTAEADADGIEAYTRILPGFSKAQVQHYEALFRGCLLHNETLDAAIASRLGQQSLTGVAPIEHALLWLGTYELQYCLDVPHRVILNEYVELAKIFGGTDGHRFVNGVLHHLAREFRPKEYE